MRASFVILSWLLFEALVESSWHFVTLSNSNSDADNTPNHETLLAAGFVTNSLWSQASFQKTNWFLDHQREIARPNVSTHVWRPMVILEALERHPDQEWVFYTDSSSLHQLPISSKFKSVMPALQAMAKENVPHQCDCIPLTRLPVSMNWEFTARNYTAANLWAAIHDISPEDPYQPWSSWSMGQASWSLWHNDHRSRRFLREWLDFMSNEKLLSSVPLADQSVCELLVAKHNMKAFWWPHPAFSDHKESGHYRGVGNLVRSILTDEAIASFHGTASMQYLHYRDRVDLVSKRVAICVTGYPGSSDPRVAQSWIRNVLRVVDADLFVVSTAWPVAHWPRAVSYLNDDFNVLDFFDQHVPTWNQSVKGNNYLGGLPGHEQGSGASQVASRYFCSKLINETEQRRGFAYEYVGVGRIDLLWPHPHPTLGRLNDPQSPMEECWVPCLRNDWRGICDHYAFCRRNASVSITTGLLDVLPSLETALNAERHLKRSMDYYHTRTLRFDVHFVRTCEDPKITGFVNPKCGFASKLQLYGKTSAGQLEPYVR